MKITEETLKNWIKRSSDTEQQKIDNAVNMIKDAIAKHDALKGKDIEIFAQGSYANNTNVRLNSDVDINIMLKDTFYSKYPNGKSREDYGFTEGTNDFDIYKGEVLKALQNKFEIDNILVGNKSFKILENSYHVEADAVATFQYRNYSGDANNDPDNFIKGVKFFDRNNNEVINYPKIHIENGIQKNTNTSRKFKRLIRIYKRAKIHMGENGTSVSDNITSFLLECLIWNLPNSYFSSYSTWNDIVKNSIIYLFNQTKETEKCKEWGEVSEMFYLFHSERKWNANDVNGFLKTMWNYFEYSNE